LKGDGTGTGTAILNIGGGSVTVGHRLGESHAAVAKRVKTMSGMALVQGFNLAPLFLSAIPPLSSLHPATNYLAGRRRQQICKLYLIQHFGDI